MLVGILLAGAVSACGDDPLAPFEPEVANLTDSFQLQATDITGITATVTYTWQNTGTTANVNQATVKNAGTAVLTISDADGTQVYSQDLAANGTFQTGAGTAGGWTIRVVLAEFSGTVNFRSEKP
jgi:hypothetical protein